MSGARIVLHLALELKRRGGGVGAAALCGGGGQGDALIVRVPSGLTAARRVCAEVTHARRVDVPALVESARAGDAAGGGAADLAGRGRVARCCAR